MKRILKYKVMPWVSLVIGLLLTIFIIVMIVFNTDFFARSSSAMFSRYLFHGTPFALSIDHVSGNPLKELTLQNLVIRYRGEDFSFDVLRIEEIGVRFSPFDFFSETPSVQSVILSNPRVWIKPDSTGSAIIPGRSEGPGGEIPDFTIGSISIEGGQFIYQGAERADAMRNIEFDGKVTSRQGTIEIEVFSGAAESLTRNVIVRRLSGGLEWKGKQGILWDSTSRSPVLVLSGLRVALEESVVDLDGTVLPESGLLDLSVGVDPVDIEEIAKALDVETGHFGELQGSFLLQGTADSVRIAGPLSGIFSGYALSDMDVDLCVLEDRIDITSASGGFNGARVTGSGRYTFHDPEILELDLDVREMDLSAGFAPGRDLPETRFNGRLQLAYSIDDGSIAFDADLDGGHLREVPFERGLIKGSYANDDLVLDRMLLVDEQHMIDAHGVIVGGDTMQLYVDAEVGAGDTLFAYLGIEEYRTDFRMSGVIEGSFDYWNWRSNGTVQNFTYRNASVDSGEIKLVVDSGDGYHVLFDLSGRGCMIDKAAFSGVDISLEYDDGNTNIKRFHLEREGFDGEARGEVVTEGALTEIRMGEVRIEAFEERWINSGKCMVLMSDSLLAFDDLQLHSRIGALYLDCRFDRGAGRIIGTLAFDRLNLDLLNRVGLVALPLGGRAEGTLSCSGDSPDPDLRLDIDMEEGTIDTVRVDQLRLRMRYADSVFHIDSLAVSSPNGRLALNGVLRDVEAADLYRGRSDALREARVESEVSCWGLNLEPFFAAISGLPFDGGSLTGSVTLSGSLVHPSAVIDGTIRDLATEYIVIPSVVLSAVLERDVIDLGGTLNFSSDHDGSFRGTVPLGRGEWFYVLEGDAPIVLELQLEKGRLERLPELTEYVAEASGEFSADFWVRGTARDPIITGQLLLHGAGFRFAGMNERFDQVDAEILLDETFITVSRLEGREGKEGKFRCGGSIALKGWRPRDYDLTIDMEKFLLSSIPDVMALLSGKIEIGSEIQEGRTVPILTGQLTVNSAEIYYDLGDFTQDDGGTTMSAATWLAEIDLAVPRNTWIKTDEARVELEGNITLHHDNRGTYFRGELRLVRGWYNVYNNKFRVRSGSFEFVKAGSFRPVIDIEAETRDPEGRMIFLVLQWHQDDIEPRLTLSHEDPGYSETDIWKMLGGGVVDSQNGDRASWDAQRTAQNLAANYIENMLNSQMSGVTIELESRSLTSAAEDRQGESETMIAIGKYLSEGLYVKYKQGLSISSAREIEVEYRISNLFLIRSQIIRHSEKVLEGKSQGSTDEINLDIKLRWEF